MHRGIDRWIGVAAAVALCLCGPTLGQEEEDADAFSRRIEERLLAEGIPGDELPERLVQAVIEELGAEAPKTLTIMANVAIQLFDDGNYAKARELFEEVLASRRRVLGAEHPDTLTAMVSLGETLRRQGDLAGARKLLEHVLETRRRLGAEHLDTLTTMNYLALTLYGQGDFSGAQELLEETLEARRRRLGAEHPDTVAAKQNLTGLLLAQGDFSGARELAEEVLEARRSVLSEEHPDTARAMGNLAAILKAQGDLSGARELEGKVLATLRRVLGAEHPDTLTAMQNLAVTLATQGDFSGARKLEEEVLETRRRVLGVEHPDTLTAMINLAVTLREQGDLSGARELEEDALATQSGVLGAEHPRTLTAMGNLAVTLKKQGDLAGARLLEEEVLEVRRRVLGEEHPDTLKGNNNLAATLKGQGDLAGARELFEEVLATRRRVLGAEHPDTLRVMNNVALTLERQGDLPGARDLFEKILATRRRVLGAEHPDTLSTMGYLADALSLRGDLSGARELLEEVLATRRRVLGAEHPDTLSTMTDLAGLLYVEGDLSAARERLMEILMLQQVLFDREYRPKTLEEAGTFQLLGRIYRALHDLEKAADFYLQAVDALEAQVVRAGISEDRRSTFRAEYDEIYCEGIATLLDLKRPAKAFNLLERSRAQSFLMMLAERDLIFSDIPPGLDQTRRSIATRYDALLQALDRPNPRQEQEEIAALPKKLKELRREREIVNARIRHFSPRLADLEDPTPLTVEQIARGLDPGTLMLSYSIGVERTDLFTLTRAGKLRVFQIPIGECVLRNQVESFNDQVNGPMWSELAASRTNKARWLYEKLVHPAAEQVEKSTRLLIIPDGPLHYLPFATLIRHTGTEAGTEPGWQYLVEWKPLHSVVSGTVYAELQKLRHSAQREGGGSRLQLAAFGNPSYPAASSGEQKNAGAVQVRGAVSRGLFDGLTPLPHSRREVIEIGGLFAEEAFETYLGNDATEERAKALGKDVRIVHFSVHGVADPLTPLDSFLALTVPDDPADGRDNGLLQAWEIFERVRLDADLVVLSGCQTAFGPQRGGEGLISLSRAFQYAGARTVAATLWSVADPSTAELMIRFYRNLRDGKPKDEALRAAQIEFIRSPIEVVNDNGIMEKKDYSAPYYWAAFQLIGDWP